MCCCNQYVHIILTMYFSHPTNYTVPIYYPKGVMLMFFAQLFSSYSLHLAVD